MSMKKIKIADAPYKALDWLVAKAEGWNSEPDANRPDDMWLWRPRPSGANDTAWLSEHRYTTDPAQAWPIIDREGIDIVRGNDLYFPKGNEKGDYYEPLRIASIGGGAKFHGPTSLIAAMRCYCAKVYGEEAEVPEEMLA